MKKFISLLLAMALGFSLIGCGAKQNDGPDNSTGTGTETPGGTTGGGTTGGNTGGTTGGATDGTTDGDLSGGDGYDESTAVESPAAITFSTGDGKFVSGENSYTLAAGGSVASLNEKGSPRRDGYAFSGWYNGDNKYDPTTTYTTETTFTAKYVSGDSDLVYEALFSTDSTVSFKIDMSDAQWKKLNHDYERFDGQTGKSGVYRKADSITISIKTGDGKLDYYYEEVGVRMKGNLSRNAFYNDGGFYKNLHLKLAFAETFDDESDYEAADRKVWASTSERKARKNRLIGGMEKLDLKYNRNHDETYCKDIYAMKLFRDNGVIAPQATLCAITAKNKDTSYKNLGVYMLYEAVDSIFIKRNLPNDAKGDLYKCSYVGTSGPADFTSSDGKVGIEKEEQGLFYSYDKKTNKKKTVGDTNNLDFTSMINFISAVNGADPDFESLIDTDYFAKFEAVNYMLGNPDCIRNNANNFYTYFTKTGKAIFIPYDYDRCLGITEGWDPTNGNSYVGGGSACTTIPPYTRMTAARGNQTNSLYIKLIDKGAPTGDGSVLQKYRTDLIALKNSQALTNNAFNAFKDGYKAKYSSVPGSAMDTNNVAFDANNTGNMSFANYISAKLNTLNSNIDNYNA